jgi:Dihydrouridine synthase (Dus)
MTEAVLGNGIDVAETPAVKPLRLGSLTLQSRYFLSPLAGYTNHPFRLAVRELGGLGLATTELVSTRALLLGSGKTSEYIETCIQDAPLAVQIYGADAGEMCDAAQWLANYGAAVIDINMGCPVNKVVKNGGGSAMMCNVGATTQLVRAIVEAVPIPVTVKMRLGWDEHTLTAPKLAREFEKAGVAAVGRANRASPDASISTASAPSLKRSNACRLSATATSAPSPTRNACSPRPGAPASASAAAPCSTHGSSISSAPGNAMAISAKSRPTSADSISWPGIITCSSSSAVNAARA